MGYLFPYHSSVTAFSGGEILCHGAPIRYEVQEIAKLRVSGSGFMQKLLRVGELVAADAFVSAINPGPFRQLVPAGFHPVFLAIAHLANGEQRVAYARVRFTTEQTVNWRAAIASEADESSVRIGQPWGYGVDSACGCFMSARAQKLSEKRFADDPQFEMQVLRDMEANGGDWVDFRPSDECEDNVIAFSSGRGDGIYASCFGLDRNDQLTDLVTDFKVSNAPDPGREVIERLVKTFPTGG